MDPLKYQGIRAFSFILNSLPRMACIVTRFVAPSLHFFQLYKEKYLAVINKFKST